MQLHEPLNALNAIRTTGLTLNEISERPAHTHAWKNGLWHSYSDHLHEIFGSKVYKLTVNAGFTCPTRDGTKGKVGCAFCDEHGSASYFSSGRAGVEVRKQIESQRADIITRFGAQKFLAYFQSFTNTYGTIDYLKEVYDSACGIDGVVGLAIGTRPDCVPDEVLELLSEYGKKTHLSLELGLQSFDDEVLKFYLRGQTAEEGFDAIARAVRYPNLSIGIHLMFGAESEARLSDDEQLELAKRTALKCNTLGVHGVKLHQLMILKGTILDTRYSVRQWPLLSMEQYNRMIMTFLEYLDPRVHVERTHALSSHEEELVGPAWASERHLPRNDLIRLMRENKSYQGRQIL